MHRLIVMNHCNLTSDMCIVPTTSTVNSCLRLFTLFSAAYILVTSVLYLGCYGPFAYNSRAYYNTQCSNANLFFPTEATLKMAGTSLSWNFLSLLLLAGVAFSYPVGEEDETDNLLVESTVREVRALPPPGFDLQAASTGGHHGSHSGGGSHGDVGYLRTKDSKGDNGYQKFDSFHKKGGDSYGYETHSSFGKAHGGETGGKYHHSGSYQDGHSDGGHYEGAHSGATGDGGHVVEHEGAAKQEKDHEGAGTEGEGFFSAALTDGEHHYGGHEGGSGEHHVEHYSSGDVGHHGDGEHHSAHYTSDGGDYHGEYHH